MLFTDRLPLRHILVFLYLLALMIVGGALFLLSRPAKTAWVLHEASYDRGTGVLRLTGKGFHPDMKGVLVDPLVDIEIEQWNVLPGLRAKALAVAEDESLALVGCQTRRLVSLSLDGGREPTVQGSLSLEGKIMRIALQGRTRALVTTHDPSALVLVDLHNPGEMRVLDTLEMTDQPGEMVLRGEVAFLSNWRRGIESVRVSGKKLELLPVVPLESAYALAGADGRLMAGTIEGNLRLFEVEGVSRLRQTTAVTLGSPPLCLALVDDLLVVGHRERSLSVYSLARWPEATLLSTVHLPGKPLRLARLPGRQGIAVSMVLAGDLLVDLKNPRLPVTIRHWPRPETALDMQAVSGTLYQASYGGVKAILLESFEENSRSAETVVDRSVDRLLDWNGTLYGVTGGTLKALAEISTERPGSWRPYKAIRENRNVLLFSMADDGEIASRFVPQVQASLDVQWIDGFLYYAKMDGIEVHKQQGRDGWQRAGFLPLKDQQRRIVPLDEKTLLSFAKSGELSIIDISERSGPVLRASFALPEHVLVGQALNGVLVAEDRAYATVGRFVLEYDLSEPDRPEVVRMVDLVETGKELALYDGLLLVASDKGFSLFDTRTDELVPVGFLQTPGRARYIGVTPDGLILCSHSNGAVRIPLPRRLDSLRIDGETAWTRLEGEYLQPRVFLYDAQANSMAEVRQTGTTQQGGQNL